MHEAAPVAEATTARFYGFVRSHLLVANNLVLAAATLAGALESLAPQLPAGPLVVEAVTAVLVVAMAAAPAAPRLAGRPMSILYTFVASHLVVANHVILASITLAGALHFVAPRLSIAPPWLHVAMAGVLLSMVAAGVAPRLASRLGSGKDIAHIVPRDPRPDDHRSPTGLTVTPTDSS